MSDGKKSIIFFALILVLWWAFSDSSDYDLKKYQKYKEDAELSDAVHEWMSDYVERYCYAELLEQDASRVKLRCD